MLVKKVGDGLAMYKFDELVLVGKLDQKIACSQVLKNSKISIYSCEDNVDSGNFVKTKLKPQKGDIILVKALQGIRLEKTVKILIKDPKRASNLLVRQDARWQ